MASPLPLEHGIKILNALKKAVNEELARKHKLAHYVVIWDGEKPVLFGDDAPVSKETTGGDS